jgi:uncharacterized protein YqjF (DUF2071 family)
VVFRTLEAGRLLPVIAARIGFGLPYHWARSRLVHRVDASGHELDFRSRRHGPGGPSTRIRARLGAPIAADAPDAALARFLTARWGFHEQHLGRTVWARNAHAPWPLVRAELLQLDDELFASAGFGDLSARPPDSVLASSGVVKAFSRATAIEALGWRLQPVARRRPAPA